MLRSKPPLLSENSLKCIRLNTSHSPTTTASRSFSAPAATTSLIGSLCFSFVSSQSFSSGTFPSAPPALLELQPCSAFRAGYDAAANLCSRAGARPDQRAATLSRPVVSNTQAWILDTGLHHACTWSGYVVAFGSVLSWILVKRVNFHHEMCG